VLILAAIRPKEENDTMPDPRTSEAAGLMLSFAERTGLTGQHLPRRYLWTDAFAVCNLLGLGRLTGEGRYTALALDLVDQVHHILGRHREDDARSGWIGGLDEAEGEAHPTRGGLRIGKKLPERGPDDPFDEELEWERDGQYFHYLTKWMHALDQVARATGQARFNVWAREMAETAQHAFTYRPGPAAGSPGMYWKMTIDLGRPLVAAMGQHDALDGYVTCLQLRATAAAIPGDGPGLEQETGRFAAMMAEGAFGTADPLGIGGLLMDAQRVEQLMRQGALPDGRLLEALLTASLEGLQDYVRGGELHMPAGYRLAFRELGLAIGLHALAAMADAGPPGPEVQALRRALTHFVPVGETIESFWRDPESRRGRTWAEHRDINEVMLATCLAPDGFLVLSGLGPG
jgi:hypothetical protein